MHWATAKLPGCGGAIKTTAADFEVTELPAYEPSGQGEHLFLWVEKQGQDTAQVARALGRALGVPERDVGYAGLKDRQARTFQYFSVPAKAAEPKLAGLSIPGATVVRSARHGNKLKSGHLRGNRFAIRVRDVKDVQAAQAVGAALRSFGCPNFFGEQRFGRKDDNAPLGKRLLLGERLPGKVGRFERRLYLSAYQSLLFNRALAGRMEAGTWNRALAGDVLKKSDSGGVFWCEVPADDQPRVDRFEVSPTGPLFGPKMMPAKAEVALLEQSLLDQEGVTAETFEQGRGETEGGRRAFRIPMADLEVTPEGNDVWISLTLPRGSYATVALSEFLKPRSPLPLAGEGEGEGSS